MKVSFEGVGEQVLSFNKASGVRDMNLQSVKQKY